jgi:hypothetical protein
MHVVSEILGDRPGSVEKEFLVRWERYDMANSWEAASTVRGVDAFTKYQVETLQSQIVDVPAIATRGTKRNRS